MANKNVERRGKCHSFVANFLKPKRQTLKKFSDIEFLVLSQRYHFFRLHCIGIVIFTKTGPLFAGFVALNVLFFFTFEFFKWSSWPCPFNLRWEDLNHNTVTGLGSMAMQRHVRSLDGTCLRLKPGSWCFISRLISLFASIYGHCSLFPKLNKLKLSSLRGRSRRNPWSVYLIPKDVSNFRRKYSPSMKYSDCNINGNHICMPHQPTLSENFRLVFDQWARDRIRTLR